MEKKKTSIEEVIEKLILTESERQIILDELFHRIESLRMEESEKLLKELKANQRGKKVIVILEKHIEYLKSKNQLSNEF